MSERCDGPIDLAPGAPAFIGGFRFARNRRDVIQTYEIGPGARFGMHHHDAGQFVWSPDGALLAETPRRTWILSPSTALWLPAGTEHDVYARRPATLHTAYLHPSDDSPTWPAPTVLGVGPLLRAVVDRLTCGDLTPTRRRHLELVLFDSLVPLDETSVSVALPTDERARQVALAILNEPGDRRSLGALGAQVGASVRTLGRLFATETGMSFGRWRTRARLHASRVLLDDGCSVTETAYRVGYSSASAFVAAFRRTYGSTPGERRARSTLTPVG